MQITIRVDSNTYSCVQHVKRPSLIASLFCRRYDRHLRSMPLSLHVPHLNMNSFCRPLYLLGPPLLLLVSLPLTIFAIITTVIAVSALTVRVSIVYFELGVALVHAYLFPPPQKPAPKQPSPRHTSPNRSRNRRSSIISTASSQDAAASRPPLRLHQKSGSFVSLIGTSEITRDFEGVGGWRVSNGDEEEALWMGMNSRLELPAVMMPVHKRKHQRSLTGGSGGHRYSLSQEAVRMNPMQSRGSTPINTGEGEGYFPPVTRSASVRPLSVASDGILVGNDRRNSSSSSSIGENSNRIGLTMKQPGG